MFYYYDSTHRGITQRHIVRQNEDGSTTWIPYKENHPELVRYHEWLAEGNEPQEWQQQEEAE